MIPWLLTSLAACIGLFLWGALESPLWAIFASNLSGVATLLIVQKLERTPRLKARWFKGTFRTWVFCVAVFGACLWVLVPELRDWQRLATYYIPLVFCAGLGAPWIFGPIQDFAIRRIQRQARGFTRPGSRAKS